MLTPADLLTYAAALLVAVLACGRAVRLITHDAWPPILLLRERWNAWWASHDLDPDDPAYDLQGLRHGWGPLMTCPFCAAPYVVAVDLLWAALADVTHPDGLWANAWWIVNLWAAASYLASMLVVRDEPPAEH